MADSMISIPLCEHQQSPLMCPWCLGHRAIEAEDKIAALESELSACRSQVAQMRKSFEKISTLAALIAIEPDNPKFVMDIRATARAALASSAPLAETRCDHPSMTGDEGPVSKLGRMPHRWKCDACGKVVDESPAHDRTVQAQALRDAADDKFMQQHAHISGRQWLRTKADALEGK